MLACFGRGRRNNSQIFDEPAAILPEDTIRNLRSHIERQEKRELFIEKKMLLLAKEAKERLKKGDKRGAVTTMKKRKMYQSELSSISNIKMTLETQAINLESAAGTADAFGAMSAGTNTMTRIRNDMGGIECVDDVLMDIQAEMHMGEELNNVLLAHSTLGYMDDDDLMKELEEEMDQGQTNNNNYNTSTVISNLPTVPTSKLLEGREADDLRKLETELREDHERRKLTDMKQHESNNEHITRNDTKPVDSPTILRCKLKVQEARDLRRLEAELQEDHDLRRLEAELAMH